MTDKELEKKAEQYSSKYARQYYHNDKSGFTTSEEEVCKAYIAGAKEIIEIEKVSDYCWEENQQLKQENKQLKAQIEKMKCCWNCKHPAKDSTGCCCPFAASCHNRSLWEMDAN